MPKKKKTTTETPQETDRSLRVAPDLFHVRLVVTGLFITLLLLFYPGDSLYVKIFAFYKGDFSYAKKDLYPLTVNPVPYVRSPRVDPVISAEGAYIITLDSATPVYERNAHRKMFPASTTKVITALTAFDAFQLDDVLTVKRFFDEGQVMDLVKGERITFENLLYGLLVYSANDAAYAIADNYPGGYDKFVKAMNRKAAMLQMKSSYFKNPAGLDADGQYASPFDLSLAGRELLKNKRLARIVSIKSITVADEDFKYFHVLSNVNKLLGEIQGVGGLKTGKTELAGENLITFYRKNGHDILIVLMKSLDRFKDTEEIVKWIDANVVYVRN